MDREPETAEVLDHVRHAYLDVVSVLEDNRAVVGKERRWQLKATCPTFPRRSFTMEPHRLTLLRSIELRLCHRPSHRPHRRLHNKQEEDRTTVTSLPYPDAARHVGIFRLVVDLELHYRVRVQSHYYSDEMTRKSELEEYIP